MRQKGVSQKRSAPERRFKEVGNLPARDTRSEDGDLPAISRLARETLILVPLGLPFFVPLAFAETLRLGFWPAFAIGLALAAATIGTYFRFAG